jgi:hypothetical protein
MPDCDPVILLLEFCFGSTLPDASPRVIAGAIIECSHHLPDITAEMKKQLPELTADEAKERLRERLIVTITAKLTQQRCQFLA